MHRPSREGSGGFFVAHQKKVKIFFNFICKYKNNDYLCNRKQNKQRTQTLKSHIKMKTEVYTIKITTPDKDIVGARWLQELVQDTFDNLDPDGLFEGRYKVEVIEK